MAFGASAQTNSAPIRLAIVPETSSSAAIVDLLTAEISKNDKVQLLERSEIEKVYREQGLSAANGDYVKLGQILGADGLLLVESVPVTNSLPAIPFATEPRSKFNIRLIAVKPGVVLVDESFLLSITNQMEWASSFSQEIDSVLPKLGVQAGDVLPISVVNFSSAIQSAEAKETEQDLKALMIQRLSKESRFFVLERQKMQLLASEKGLKADESPFWSGSYLLEGAVDQNGYSKETVTINARLTPPKGARPMLIEVAGSRTNLAEVVNSLAAKVAALLKVNSSITQWNTADEAARYFSEGEWALRWKLYAEAQMASESAWALGKRDLAGALLRVRAYSQGVMAEVGEFERGDSSVSSGFDYKGDPTGPEPTDEQFNRMVNRLRAEHKYVVIRPVMRRRGVREVSYVFSDRAPEVESIDHAIYALEIYRDFSRASADGEPKILWRSSGWNDWHDSEWYKAGIEDLVAASKVLQNFNLESGEQKSVADKLAELRALARSVAAMISSAPSIHDSYFVGDRVARRDELSYTMQENNNIFVCEVDWGSYWQETPEACLVLYRDLLASPVFCYIHHDFWYPNPPASRLTAWNKEDERRIPIIWKGFVEELASSTNILWQMEAKALAIADAESGDQATNARNALLQIVENHRTELVNCNVELFYLGWGLGYKEFEPLDFESLLAAQKRKEQQAKLEAFAKQKQFLSSFAPYDAGVFNPLFAPQDYTRAQASELLPLVIAYKSNLLAQVPPNSTQLEKLKIGSDVNWIGFYLESRIKTILNAPSPAPVTAPVASPPLQNTVVVQQPVTPPKKAPSFPVSKPSPELVTNILSVNEFLPIPLDDLGGSNIWRTTILAHHWMDGKLVLNFQFGTAFYSYDVQGRWSRTRYTDLQAIVIFDPLMRRWLVAACPESDIASRTRYYHRTAYVHGELFDSDGGQIRKYDFASRQWQTLPVSSGENYELFNVNGHLYAATQNLIAEVTDDGQSMRILASNRRSPPVSSLDAEDLGMPGLFSGPEETLRAVVGAKIVGWNGSDWHSICAAPGMPLPINISDDAILFFGDGWNSQPGIWRFHIVDDHVEYCLGQVGSESMAVGGFGGEPNMKSLWKMPRGARLSKFSAASRGPDLYLMGDYSTSTNIVDVQHRLVVGKQILPQDGYHAELLCFTTNDPLPQKVFLKFDAEDAAPPVSGGDRSNGFMIPNTPHTWLTFSSNYLFIGMEVPNALPVGAGAEMARQPRTGIWIASLDKIDAEISRQKNEQLEQQVQNEEQAKLAGQHLLEKYDRNHNGIIDPDEREDALDDPAYIESQLESIDTNHNGWLEASELVWFDANHNQTLDPKEQQGIEIAQQLLAKRLLEQFDVDGNGYLTMQGYQKMVHATMPGQMNLDYDIVSSGDDGNRVDLEKLERVLKRHTMRTLAAHGRGRPIFAGGGMMPPDTSDGFKAAVESYWQNPNGNFNRLSPGEHMHFGPGFAPGQNQNRLSP